MTAPVQSFTVLCLSCGEVDQAVIIRDEHRASFACLCGAERVWDERFETPWDGALVPRRLFLVNE